MQELYQKYGHYKNNNALSFDLFTQELLIQQ